MATFNFPQMIQGDTFEGVRLTMSKNGSPLDLTNGSIVMTATANNSPFIYSTQNGNLSIVSGSSGIFEFDKQVINLPVYGNVPYEITFYLSNGDIKTYISGLLDIVRA